MVFIDHDRAVTKHYLVAENSLSDGYWSDVFREVSYYENQESPVPDYPSEKGREVGEFDVLCVNFEDKLAFYKELKTGYGDMLKAKKQVERAEDFFEDTEWDVITSRVLENE